MFSVHLHTLSDAHLNGGTKTLALFAPKKSICDILKCFMKIGFKIMYLTEAKNNGDCENKNETFMLSEIRVQE